MSFISRGFRGRRSVDAPPDRVPPGQYVTADFPVLSAGPTPIIVRDDWRLAITRSGEELRGWTWAEFTALPSEDVSVDLHCVTKWSKLDTSWQGVSIDRLLAGVESPPGFVMIHAYGGYTTNLPIAEVTGGKAWIAYRYDGRELDPEHGGPARLLVPHLYLWKSAKWVRSLELTQEDEPGFWERYGYHDHGDPWLEQRYSGD